jgi:hypothetical protein
MSNSGFDRIKESKNEKYYYLNLRKSFEKYVDVKTSYLWQKGTSSQLFSLQFYGREQVNVGAWFNCLRKGNRGVLYVFDRGVSAVDFVDIEKSKPNFQAAWDSTNSRIERK